MIEIKLSEEFSKDFIRLQKRLEIGDGEASHLCYIIENCFRTLLENYRSGQRIQKRLWPRFYVKKFGINNLWRFRLDRLWRLIYSIDKSDSGITILILEVLNHTEYNRRFGYQ